MNDVLLALILESIIEFVLLLNALNSKRRWRRRKQMGCGRSKSVNLATPVPSITPILTSTPPVSIEILLEAECKLTKGLDEIKQEMDYHMERTLALREENDQQAMKHLRVFKELERDVLHFKDLLEVCRAERRIMRRQEIGGDLRKLISELREHRDTKLETMLSTLQLV